MRGDAGAVVLDGEGAAARGDAHMPAPAVLGAVDEQLFEDEEQGAAVGGYGTLPLDLDAHARREQQLHLAAHRLVGGLPQVDGCDLPARVRAAQPREVQHALGEVVRPPQLHAQLARVAAVGEDERAGGQRRLEFVHPTFDEVCILLPRARRFAHRVDSGARDLLHHEPIFFFYPSQRPLEHFAEEVFFCKGVRRAVQADKAAARTQPAEQQRYRREGEREDDGEEDEGQPRPQKEGAGRPCGRAEQDAAGGHQLRTQIAEKAHNLYPTPRTVRMRPSAPIDRSFSRRRLMCT